MFKYNLNKFLHAGFLLSIGLVAFFLPLRVHYSNIFVGFAVGFWVLNLRFNTAAYRSSFKFPILVFTSIYALHVAGMINTSNMAEGWSILEKKLALLSLPVVILINPLTKKEIGLIFLFLFFGLLIALAYCYYQTFSAIAVQGDSPRAIFTIDRYQNLAFSSHINIHPAYLSNLLIISLLSFMFWFRESVLGVKLIALAMAVIFVVTIVILNARVSILAIVLILPIVFVFLALEKKSPLLLIAGAVVIVSAVSMANYSTPWLKSRLFESVDSYAEMVQNNDQYHSIPMHAKIWYCASDVNRGLNIWIGQGTGDERDALYACYQSRSWDYIAKARPDSHNEYLSAYVRHGVCGLIVWLLCLGYGFHLAYTKRDLAFICFMILMAVSAMSESILRGQVPLLSFALFYLVFVKYCFVSMTNDNIN